MVSLLALTWNKSSVERTFGICAVSISTAIGRDFYSRVTLLCRSRVLHTICLCGCYLLEAIRLLTSGFR